MRAQRPNLPYTGGPKSQSQNQNYDRNYNAPGGNGGAGGGYVPSSSPSGSGNVGVTGGGGGRAHAGGGGGGGGIRQPQFNPSPSEGYRMPLQQHQLQQQPFWGPAAAYQYPDESVLHPAERGCPTECRRTDTDHRDVGKDEVSDVKVYEN
ncbi:hypothetical protein BV898_03593 [Hypsibius exemplaris]|uniref:Uncharacterized protein n=1 Tax=Hypsibius exemplaris TaxID=2072580 RepID=A0A1W0X4Y3_HYPEX|nr:hypothetical protein BV898_03593 [Hypsibius exemplaris]